MERPILRAVGSERFASTRYSWLESPLGRMGGTKMAGEGRGWAGTRLKWSYSDGHLGCWRTQDIAVLAWLVNTAASAVVGLIVGFAVVAVVSRFPRGKPDTPSAH